MNKTQNGVLYAVLFSLYMLEFQLFFYMEGKIDGVLSFDHYLIWIVVSAGFILFGASRHIFKDISVRQIILMAANIIYGISMVGIHTLDKGTISKVLLFPAGLSIGCLGGAVCYFMAVEFYMRKNAGLFMAISASVPYILQWILTPVLDIKPVSYLFLVGLFILISYVAIWHPRDFVLEDSLPYIRETRKYRDSLIYDKARVLAVFLVLLLICTFMEHTWSVGIVETEIDMYGWQRRTAILGYFCIGFFADFKKHKYLDIFVAAIICMYMLGTFAAENYGIRLAFFYFIAGVYTGYLNLAFWFIAPKTRHPDIWASLGRVLSFFEGIAAIGYGFITKGSFAEQMLTGGMVVTLMLLMYFMKNKGTETGISFEDNNGDNECGTKSTDEVGTIADCMNNEAANPDDATGEDAIETNDTVTGDSLNAQKKYDEERFNKFCDDRRMTPRERDVMRLLLNSDKNMKLLAEQLGISERMLYRYMNSLYEKVGTENRAGLVRKYYE